MAEILDFTLEINGIEKTIKSVEDLESSIKDLQNTIKSNQGRGVLDNTELEKNLARLEKLRLEAKATKEAIKQTSVDGAKSMGTLREAFDGAGAAAEILSGENEKVGRVVMTVMKAIGAANSAREVSENKSTIAIVSNRIATTANIAVQKLYDATLKGTIVSLNTFKIALAATGIGVVVLAVIALADAYKALSQATKTAGDYQNEYNKEIERYDKLAQIQRNNMEVRGATEAELYELDKEILNGRMGITTANLERQKKELQAQKIKFEESKKFYEKEIGYLKAVEFLTKGPAAAARLGAELGKFFAEGGTLNIEGASKAIEELENNILNLQVALSGDSKKLKGLGAGKTNGKSPEKAAVEKAMGSEEEFKKALEYSTAYFDRQQSLLLERQLKGEDVSYQLTQLEKERFDAAMVIMKDYDMYDKTIIEAELNRRKSVNDKIVEDQKELNDKLKELREKEFEGSIKNSKDYYTEQQTLLLNRAAEGYNIEEEMRQLELEGLEAQLQVYRDYGESTIEIENQIAAKKKEIREAERQATIDSINGGLEVFRAGIQASIDLENVRKENALNNQNLTEEEREKIAKESFEKQKKLQLQMAYVDAAKSVTSILAQYPKFDGGIAMFAAIATAAIMNTAAITRIKRTQYQGASSGDEGNDGQPSKFARGGILVGPLHSQGGIRTSFGELEGGEFVVNRRSTRMYGGLISAINQAGGGRKFATGGILGLEDQLQSLQKNMNQTPVVKAYVLEGDISSAMEAEQKIKYRTTL